MDNLWVNNGGYDMMMDYKLYLTDSSKGDSRTSGGQPSREDVDDAIEIHKKDIYNLLKIMQSILEEKGLQND